MAKKEKTKKTTKVFWNKLEYWKRGGLIGFIVGIVYYGIFLYDRYSLTRLLGDNPATILDVVSLQFVIPSILILTIYGGLYGTFLEKISSKKKNTKIGLIIVYTIISAIIFFYIWLYMVVIIAKPY
ncbi:MAG: hypothetical protein U9O94_11680 [Nanoarchaeota archaeon]|nr:hypothetical protein [Nanoarchaeota archaeon]